MKRWKNVSRRGLSMLLVLVMCVGMLQIPAFAEEGTPSESTPTVSESTPAPEGGGDEGGGETPSVPGTPGTPEPGDGQPSGGGEEGVTPPVTAEGDEKSEDGDEGVTPPATTEGGEKSEGEEEGDTPPVTGEDDKKSEDGEEGDKPPVTGEDDKKSEGGEEGDTPPATTEGDEKSEGGEEGDKPPVTTEGDEKSEDEEEGDKPPVTTEEEEEEVVETPPTPPLEIFKLRSILSKMEAFVLTEDNMEEFYELGMQVQALMEALEDVDYTGKEDDQVRFQMLADKLTGGVDTTARDYTVTVMAVLVDSNNKVVAVNPYTSKKASLKTPDTAGTDGVIDGWTWSASGDGYTMSAEGTKTNVNCFPVVVYPDQLWSGMRESGTGNLADYKGFGWSIHQPYVNCTIGGSYSNYPHNNTEIYKFKYGTGSYGSKQTANVTNATGTFIYYIFSAQKVKLTYDANGGSGAPAAEEKTLTGSSVTFNISSTKPTRNGYTFLGWSNNSGTGQTVHYTHDGANSTAKTISISKDKTLYAVWAPNCTVTYDDGDANGRAFTQQVYPTYVGADTPAFNGDTSTLTYTDNGVTYKFTGWSPAVEEKVAGRTTYVAQWEKQSGGGTTDPGTTKGSFTVKKSFVGLGDDVEAPMVTLTYNAYRTKDGITVGTPETGTVTLTKQSDGTYTGTITPTVWDIGTSSSSGNYLSETERERYKNVVEISEELSTAMVENYTHKSFKPFYLDGNSVDDDTVKFVMDGATFEKTLSVKNTYTKNQADDGKGISIEKSRVSINDNENATTAYPGDAIKWEIKVTNNSNVTKTVTLTEKLVGASLSKNEVTLEAGKSETVTATYTVKGPDVGKTIVNTVVGKTDPNDPGTEGKDTGTRVPDPNAPKVTVKWVNYDGTVLQEPIEFEKDYVPEGKYYQTPTDEGGLGKPLPTRDPDDNYTYTFKEWRKDVDGDGNVTYTAVYEEHAKPNTVTVNYVTDGETPVTLGSITYELGKDSPYNHSVGEGTTVPMDGGADVKSPKSITKDGHTYAYDPIATTDALEGRMGDESIVINVVYSLDDKGGNDPTDPEGGPDGIPDKYQAKVVYAAGAGGTITSTPTSEYRTIMDDNGQWATEGTISIAGATATADEGHTFNKWTAAAEGHDDWSYGESTEAKLEKDDNVSAKGGAVYTFTANFLAKEGTKLDVAVEPVVAPYDGATHPVTPTTNKPEAEVTVTYSYKDENGDTVTLPAGTEPTDAGVYDVTITAKLGEEEVTKTTTVTITKRPLTISTDSASKTYDGTALFAPGRISGLVNNETVTFTVTGSQTEVGNSRNGYTLTWDGTAKEGNYTVTVETIGTLTVNARTGGGGGGGRDPRPDPDPRPTPDPTPTEPDTPDEPPVVDITDPDVPLTDIPDTDVPLTDIPDEEIPLTETPEEVVELPDEDVPLDATPRTGDSSRASLWLLLCGLSLLGTVLLVKKREGETA